MSIDDTKTKTIATTNVTETPAVLGTVFTLLNHAVPSMVRGSALLSFSKAA